MIKLHKNLSLKQYNTFGIDVKADSFLEFTSDEDLLTIFENKLINSNYIVLGGGSNMLFINHFNGIIIYPAIKGINVVSEDSKNVYVEAGAGEKWDDLVEYAVSSDLGGIENLSDIPGHVGASPVQNIGAYGTEVKDSIYLVKGFFIEHGSYFEYSNSSCHFDYRNSIFKQSLKGKVIITSVIFKLNKTPVFNLEYGALKTEVEKRGEVNLQNIRDAVINIRKSKLPDPLITGNAGSFFKNPVVDSNVVESLKVKFANIPVYVSGEKGKLKIAAGWLIDQCGWKGYREGDAGVHKDQALVLVNYGNAKGSDILNVAEKIKASVVEEFGITLEPEVNVVN
ncbi:MAG: UDP-N-acetylmuramate dehydrogenase [Prolixibacteraceae bacterium]|nr:UDP-N-acetylmuramate dehydrogenase [Prolixibacteraceae bacterium]